MQQGDFICLRYYRYGIIFDNFILQQGKVISLGNTALVCPKKYVKEPVL